jgi:HlyD family secretion protein
MIKPGTIILSLLCAGGVATTASLWEKSTSSSTDVAPAAGPQPRATSPPQRIRGIGYVEPASEIRRLVFKIDGVVEHVAVDVGDHVEGGAVLMTLRNHDEQAALAEANKQLSVAVAQRDQLLAGAHPDEIEAARCRLDVLRENLRLAQKNDRRIRELAEKHAVSDQERDKADSDLRRCERELRQAEAEHSHLQNTVRVEDRHVVEARVQLAEARLDVARQRLENTVLHAPFAGSILEILKREGEGARVLDREPVIVFADNSHLRVRAEIDERYVHLLSAGQAAEVYGRGLGESRFPGTVSLVKRVMGNKTVFSHEASERKDLDVIQILIDLPEDFAAPLGLQVDVDIRLTEGTGR